MQVTITKGQHKGKAAIITETQSEYIGSDLVYKLKDAKTGELLWNGQFSWFPECFVEKFN